MKNKMDKSFSYKVGDIDEVVDSKDVAAEPLFY